jgi:hypothetical protein
MPGGATPYGGYRLGGYAVPQILQQRFRPSLQHRPPNGAKPEKICGGEADTACSGTLSTPHTLIVLTTVSMSSKVRQGSVLHLLPSS